MCFIRIDIDDAVKLSLREDMPTGSHLEVIHIFPDEGSIIFYDWLEDNAGNLAGLELHIDSDHPFLGQLQGKSFVKLNGFPQVFLSQSRNVTPRHLEAFGDIFLFQKPTGKGSIVVGLDQWISEVDKEYLVQMIQNRA